MDGMSAYIERNEQINNTDTGICDFGAKVLQDILNMLLRRL